jgi:hypothetical protein
MSRHLRAFCFEQSLPNAMQDGAPGRIYLVDSDGGRETWFWGASFQVTGRKSYGADLVRIRP